MRYQRPGSSRSPSDRSLPTAGRLFLAAALAVGVAACGDDGPTEPDLTRADVAGTYALTTLQFDPQGSLPEVDIRERLEIQNPSLQLTSDGIAQLVWRDPATNLVTTIEGTFSIRSDDEVRVDFGGGSQEYRTLLLSQRMTFVFETNPNSLVFTGTPPDGVEREELLELVPEFQGEQLLDPVPGELTVVFQR